MKIGSIQNSPIYLPKAPGNLNFCGIFATSCPANGDVFVRNNSAKNEKENHFSIVSLFKNVCAPKSDPVREFYKKQDKLSVSEFLSLSEGDKYTIKNTIGLECMPPAIFSVNYAEGLKEMLDETYGEDGYVFCSVGRSPSLIAKVFECMGVETRYLPISKLATPEIGTLLYEHSFDKYGEFLESQGLTPEMMNKSGKTYIFYDYTLTGKTLKKFETILEDRFHLPKDRMEFRSLNDDLLDLYEGEVYIDDSDAVVNYIETYFLHSGSETYSSITELPVSKVDEADYSKKGLTVHGKNNAKFYNFYIMDTLNRKGLLKENPDNACAL